MSSERPKLKISDTRVYSYDETVECQSKQYDFDEFEFNISPMETDF